MVRVERIWVIKDPEIPIDPRLLDVGAFAAPSDVWRLQAIGACPVSTKRIAIWKRGLKRRQNALIQNEALKF
jgi:hypothetical protein